MLEGGSWSSYENRIQEYEQFMDNVFMPLYNMSANKSCHENEEYIALLKKCEQFEPYRYVNMWEASEKTKNLLIEMILEQGGYYLGYTETLNKSVPIAELKIKLRFITNLFKYTDFVYSPRYVPVLINKYMPDEDNDDCEFVDLLQDMKTILAHREIVF